MIVGMWKRVLLSAVLIIFLMGLSITCMVSVTIYARHGLGSDEYILPLVADVGVRRESLVDAHFNAPGSYQLVDFSEPASRSLGIRYRDVKRLAVIKTFVVGETEGGFFINNSAEEHYDERKVIATREAWQLALVAAGLPRDVKLIEPDVTAAGVSNRILRRRQMRVMRGALSLTDADWEGVLIVGSWLFMLLFGTYAKKKLIIPTALIAGMFSVGFARLYLGECGPDLIAGVFDPPMCIGAGFLGRLVGLVCECLWGLNRQTR